MAYDRDLADRVRSLIPPDGGFTVKEMFGGIGFLLNGNMCLGVWKDRLILRLGVDEAEKALKTPGFGPFDITGRPMKGWVMAIGRELGDDDLFRWAEKAVAFVAELPPKSTV